MLRLPLHWIDQCVPCSLLCIFYQRYSVKTLNFSANALRPDWPPILATMFALIAVIVKRETRLISDQQSAISYQQKQGLIKIGALTLESLC